MSNLLNLIQQAEELEAKATPGSWIVGATAYKAGVNDGSHKNWIPAKGIPRGKCALCGNGCHLLETRVEDGATFHIHLYVDPDDWHDICADGGVKVAGQYDYEEGGIASKPEDSAFIASSRNHYRALLDVARAAHDLLDKATKMDVRASGDVTIKGFVGELDDLERGLERLEAAMKGNQP